MTVIVVVYLLTSRRDGLILYKQADRFFNETYESLLNMTWLVFYLLYLLLECQVHERMNWAGVWCGWWARVNMDKDGRLICIVQRTAYLYLYGTSSRQQIVPVESDCRCRR